MAKKEKKEKIGGINDPNGFDAENFKYIKEMIKDGVIKLKDVPKKIKKDKK